MVQVVAYINVDVAVTGVSLVAESSPSLASLIRAVSDAVYDPRVNMSVGAYWSSVDPSRDVGGLGSGSDYTPFLQFAGVSSLSLEFRGDYGVYHSIYDSEHYVQTQYAASGLNVLAQMWALIVLNLTDAHILPFNTSEYAVEMSSHEQQLISLLNQTDITLDLTNLHQAIDHFTRAANNMSSYIISANMSANDTDSVMMRQINDALFKTERAFLSNTTFPGRSDHWYKHVIYAPGLYAGYAPVVFPGIVDGIRATVGYNDHPLNISQRTQTGQKQADIAAECIMAAANVLLNRTSPPPPPPSDPCLSTRISVACIASLIDDSAIASHLTSLTSYPTLAGTTGSYNAAQYVQSALTAYGLASVIEQYDVLLSYPISTYVARVDSSGAVLYRCNLSEPAIPADPTSGDVEAVHDLQRL